MAKVQIVKSAKKDIIASIDLLDCFDKTFSLLSFQEMIEFNFDSLQAVIDNCTLVAREKIMIAAIASIKDSGSTSNRCVMQ